MGHPAVLKLIPKSTEEKNKNGSGKLHFLRMVSDDKSVKYTGEDIA